MSGNERQALIMLVIRGVIELVVLAAVSVLVGMDKLDSASAVGVMGVVLGVSGVSVGQTVAGVNNSRAMDSEHSVVTQLVDKLAASPPAATPAPAPPETPT